MVGYRTGAATPEAPKPRSVELSRPQTKVFKARTPLILDMAGQRAGKSEMIGVLSGRIAMEFPKVRQFIGANTYLQLTQSTLVKATEVWAKLYGLTRYDRKNNPSGDYVIDRVPPDHFHRFQEYKEYHNIISFRNGHVIYVGSLDNYEAHDGKEFGIAHLDETKSTKKEAVTTVITARLSQSGLRYDRNNPDRLMWVEEKPVPDDQLASYREATGHDFQFTTPEEVADLDTVAWMPLYVHTSPAVGTVDWLLEMFELGGQERNIKDAVTKGRSSFYFSASETRTCIIYPTHFNEKNLPAGYIAQRSLTLSENEYLKFVCGYPFSKSGGEYYPKFDRLKHIQPWEENPEAAAHFSIDYNVLPYMSGLLGELKYVTRHLVTKTAVNGTQYYEKHDEPVEGSRPLKVLQIGIHTEFALKSPLNTVVDLCQAIRDRYVQPKSLFLYGDASGKSRIAGMGAYTHFSEITRQLSRFVHTGSDRTPRANMGVMTRRDIMNRIFEGKVPQVELIIDPSCEELIRDLEFLKLGAAGKDGEKGGKHKEIAHTEDGVAYQKLGHMSDALEYLVCEIVKHFINLP